jgi:hypothetical protein
MVRLADADSDGAEKPIHQHTPQNQAEPEQRRQQPGEYVEGIELATEHAVGGDDDQESRSPLVADEIREHGQWKAQQPREQGEP